MTFSPRTWVVGETVTAAMMNSEIRDQFNSMFSAWTPYTPTWTAATSNPVLGNGTIVARYMKWGRTCTVAVEQTMGSTTTYGSGQWSWTLPFQATTTTAARIGDAQALSASRIAGHIVVASGATTFSAFFPASTTVSNLGNNGASNPFTWAATNVFRTVFTYETAS